MLLHGLCPGCASSHLIRKMCFTWPSFVFTVFATPLPPRVQRVLDPARHGNTERRIIHHAKKKEYESMLDRFLIRVSYRQSQIDIKWTEEHCARLDEIAAEDHSYIATAAERTRRENTWVLVFNSSNQVRTAP